MYEGYDVAQICLNGHVVNSSFRQLPKHSSLFCGQCGAATIIQCPSCKTDIRGHFWGTMGFFRPGSYCLNCGKPYPWTESKLQAARELAGELENLTLEEKEALTKSIDDILSDSPRTALGATRFKKIMLKVGKEGASALKNILVDIVSEAAKKTIWP
jgi:hypothetical protein